MIYRDFLKALGQIGDPQFLRIIGFGVLASGLLMVGAIWLLQVLLPEQISLPWIGDISWLVEWIANIAFWGMLFLSVFLMMPIASFMIGFMLDPIAKAVEAKHYAELPQPAARPLLEQMSDATRFMIFLIAMNALALIIYFTSNLLAPIIFWVVNGILLGREYFQLVAMRHLGRAGATALRARYRFRIWFAGILMAIPLSIPVLNLIIPVLGVAIFTHMYHRLSKAE
ncbi:MAG: EI24 domain-containing protein [Pseudomonadota bacterium]